jgi:hypothetical protein
MVHTPQAILDFVRFARIYVTNRYYPSIHVYTVDETLMHYLRVHYSARVLPHKGTHDVVISKREQLSLAAATLAAYGDPKLRPAAVTLIRYCTRKTPEERRLVARRLMRQLKCSKRSHI